MSILIPGVSMPKEYPLWVVVHADGTVEYNELSIWQTANEKAIPVPEHGDLIDRSELRISTAVPLNGEPYQYIYIDNINNAPTIIPADERLYDSLKRGLEQAINGECRSKTVTIDK